MKKLFLAIVIASLTCCVTFAREMSTTNPSVLPAKARTFIAKNFKKGINHIKVDKKTFGSTEYDVILNDGTEIEFNSDGNWENVDCGNSAVPNAIVPTVIRQHISKYYKKAKITEIEINRNTYEIKLSTGQELTYDRSGRFLRQED